VGIYMGTLAPDSISLDSSIYDETNVISSVIWGVWVVNIELVVRTYIS
jgi:hypothetical protein